MRYLFSTCSNNLALLICTIAPAFQHSSAAGTTIQDNVDSTSNVEEELSDQEVEAFITSIFLIAGVTILFCIMFHRANKNYNNDQNDNNTLTAQAQAIRRAEMEQIHLFAEAQARSQREDDDLIGIRVSSSPDSKLLVDGILPYRHGKARKWKMTAMRENESQPKGVTPSILGKMPASKGCNVVFTIREGDLLDDVNMSVICDTLTMIGSDFNLFCILDILPNATDQMTNDIMAKLNGIPEVVLPRHRIVATKTVTGRVAFVRQLRPEIVVDYDVEVEKQLTRFGFRVVIYEEAGFGKCHG